MIEILVVRDPDSENEIRIWRDGLELSLLADDVRFVNVDAGAGYDFADWRETADNLARELDEGGFRDAVIDAYFDPPGHRYIDGFKELAGYPFMCRTCGRSGTEDDGCEIGEPCPDEECDGIIEHNWEEPWR